MLNFVICDDNNNHNYFMERWLKKVFEKNNIEAELFVTDDSEKVLEYSRKHYDRVNAYILDIDFKGSENGLDIAAKIREKDRRSYIVFITAHEEYSMPSFRLKTFDFLVKPVSSARIEKFVLSLVEDYRQLKSFEIKVPIRSGTSIYMTSVNDIIYFEKNGPSLIAHLKNGTIRSYEPLKQVEEEMRNYGFFRCHRSFLINPGHVEKICLKEKCIHLSNGDKCDISRRHRKEVLEHFSDIV